MFLVGLIFVAIGIALLIFGMVYDDFEFEYVFDGELLRIPSTGNTILIVFAVAAVLFQLFLEHIVGVEGDYTFTIFIYVCCAVAVKLGFLSVPLVIEAIIPIIAGVELVIPSAMEEKFQGLLEGVPGAIIFLVLVIIVSVRIRSNN